RQHAGTVAGMDTGVLNVLHDPADHHRVAVGDRVDVDFDSAFEVAIDEQGMLLGGGQGVLDVGLQRGLVGGDFHGAAAQHVGGPNQDRVADAPSAGERLVKSARQHALRL